MRRFIHHFGYGLGAVVALAAAIGAHQPGEAIGSGGEAVVAQTQNVDPQPQPASANAACRQAVWPYVPADCRGGEIDSELSVRIVRPVESRMLRDVGFNVEPGHSLSGF